MSSAPESGWVDTSRDGPPPSEVSIDAGLVEALIASQATAFSDAAIGERFDGWDMAVFRLGDTHALRLPRTRPAVTSLATEIHGLTQLAAGWTFPHPSVVHVGGPGEGYPWPWAITSWLEGDTADGKPLAADAGAEVGAALAQVHEPAPADAPFNLEQSIPLGERGDHVEWALGIVIEREGTQGERLDGDAARELWNAARAAPERAERTWAHADCHGSNLLSDNGRFAGIIDWGKMAACDRAVDLAFLYTAMPREGVEAAIAAYRDATGVDDPGLERRARGIALAKAAAWATLEREVNVRMAWRAFAHLDVIAG